MIFFPIVYKKHIYRPQQPTGLTLSELANTATPNHIQTNHISPLAPLTQPTLTLMPTLTPLTSLTLFTARFLDAFNPFTTPLLRCLQTHSPTAHTP